MRKLQSNPNNDKLKKDLQKLRDDIRKIGTLPLPQEIKFPPSSSSSSFSHHSLITLFISLCWANFFPLISVFVFVVLFLLSFSSLFLFSLLFFSLSAQFSSAPSTAWILQLKQSSALSFLCMAHCKYACVSLFTFSFVLLRSFTHGVVMVVVVMVVAMARKRAGGQADHDRQGGAVLLPHPTSQLHRSSCHLHVNAKQITTWPRFPPIFYSDIYLFLKLS